MRAADAIRLVRETDMLRRFVIIALCLQIAVFPIFKLLPKIATDISNSSSVNPRDFTGCLDSTLAHDRLIFLLRCLLTILARLNTSGSAA